MNYALDSMLFILPISLVMLNVTEMMFQYQYPGRAKKMLIRLLYTLFFIIYLVLGVLITYVDVDTIGEQYDVMFLWNSASSLVLSVLMIFPSFKLLKTVSYPVIQPEDVKCVRTSKLALVLFVVINLCESIYNLTVFLGCNYIRNWLQKDLEKYHLVRNGPRAFYFMYELIFDFIPSVLAVISVHQIRQHDLQFADDPFYAQEQTEST